MTVKVSLTNKSETATGEVVQIYVKALESANATPGGKLCAFSRVFLNGGETKEVELKIGTEAFTVVNEEGERLVDGSLFQFSAGLGQPDARTRELTGKEWVAFTVKRK